MKAYYYEIVEFTESSLHEGEVIDNGIIRDSEDTIYPAQNTGILVLPYECEAHHFHCEGYKLNGFYFDVPIEVLEQFKV